MNRSWSISSAPLTKENHPVFPWIQWRKTDYSCMAYAKDLRPPEIVYSEHELCSFAVKSSEKDDYIPLGSMLHRVFSTLAETCDECVLRAARMNRLLKKSKIKLKR